MTRPAVKREELLNPEVRALARRLREGRTYQLLAFCPHDGTRKFAAALLVGQIQDEVRKLRPGLEQEWKDTEKAKQWRKERLEKRRAWKTKEGKGAEVLDLGSTSSPPEGPASPASEDSPSEGTCLGASPG